MIKYLTLRFLNQMLQLDRRYKQLFVATVDAFICVVAVQLAFSLRLGEWVPFDASSKATTLLALALWAPIYIGFGTYRTIFRFAGSGTMLSLARVTAIYAIPIAAICMVWTIPGVPRTIGLIFPIIFFLLLCFSRIFARYIIIDILSQRRFVGEPRRVLIYGAGSSGKQLANSLRHEPGMRLLGFIDDNPRLDSQTLDGLKIYHRRKLIRLIDQFRISDIVLAMPSNSKAQNKRIVESLEQFGLHVRTLPSIAQLVEGHISSQDLREINVEDLLGRDAVPPNPQLVGATITGKRVMVTGAGGSIGSELCRQIVLLKPKQLVLVEMTEYALYSIEQDLEGLLVRNDMIGSVELLTELANVANHDLVARMFERWRPETVFHAAAYKHVPLVECNPIGGINNNIFGTLYVALAAERVGVSHFVLVSTDKAVRPTNIMGASKRVCELILQARAALSDTPRFSMVRFGNVLGSSGSVVPRFEKQIRDGGPVTLTHRDVTRYFMTIPEAAQLVIQAGAMAKGGEVFVLDMGKPVRIMDLAVTMVRLAGLTVRDSANPFGDIEIHEVGLRPGEKLYEELLIDNNAQATAHERIMRANENFIAWDDLKVTLDLMRDAIDAGRKNDLLALLQVLVPEYTSPNSSAQELVA